MSKRDSLKPAFDDLFFSRTNQFLKIYLPNQLNRSQHTTESYSYGLSVFFDYISNVKKISPMHFTFADCTYNLVLDYMQYLQDDLGNSPSTVNSRLASIRSYLGFASDCDVSLTSIYLSIKRVPTLAVTKPKRPIIEPEDLAVFLNLPKPTHTGNRDRFILILLYDSGIRVSELTQITIGDISVHDSSYSILIHGKGRKERYIILSEKAAEHMKGYLKAYHGLNPPPDHPLIFTKTHGNISPMSARNIERITEKYGKQAREICPGFPSSTYPHMLRRTRGTTLYRDGVPLEQISALLGHSQIETTRLHYASPSPEQMRTAVNRAVGNEPETKEWINHIDEMKARFGLK